jgi:acyl carrier protein
MHLERSQVADLIRNSLEQLNAERGPGEQVEIVEDTLLLTTDSELDSLAFISFVADLEDRLKASTERDFVLVGELDASENHPFRSASSLADHIVGMAAGMP